MSDPQLRWLRLWTDIIDEAKLLLLSPADRWYYVAVLALKRSGMLDESDVPDVLDKKVGLRLRLTKDELDETKNRLITARLIDSGWQPSGWNNRQFESDVSTSRTRKWRRNQKRSRNVPETFPKRHGNAPETEQRQSRADTENNPLTPLLNQEAFERFRTYRKSLGKPIRPASIDAAQRALAKFGEDQAAIVEQSIANGWQGLFALKPAGVSSPRIRIRTADEIEAEERARAAG